MSEIQILPSAFKEHLKLHYAQSIKAGFPSPAENYHRGGLDFNRDLIKNPEATFYGRVGGDSMIEASICYGDISDITKLTMLIVINKVQCTNDG